MMAYPLHPFFLCIPKVLLHDSDHFLLVLDIEEDCSYPAHLKVSLCVYNTNLIFDLACSSSSSVFAICSASSIFLFSRFRHILNTRQKLTAIAAIMVLVVNASWSSVTA